MSSNQLLGETGTGNKRQDRGRFSQNTARSDERALGSNIVSGINSFSFIYVSGRVIYQQMMYDYIEPADYLES